MNGVRLSTVLTDLVPSKVVSQCTIRVCTCSIECHVLRVTLGVSPVMSVICPISHVHVRESTGRLKNKMKGNEHIENDGSQGK
jgi:hypothetical protein